MGVICLELGGIQTEKTKAALEAAFVLASHTIVRGVRYMADAGAFGGLGFQVPKCGHTFGSAAAGMIGGELPAEANGDFAEDGEVWIA